jgi:hypothetical protein
MSLIVQNSWRRWVNGVIPFKEHSSMNADPTLKTAAAQARQAWEAVTPVRFVAQNNEPDFILFKRIPGAPRCSSPAGRKGGEQELKCDSGFTVGALVHELGHAIGLQHEHQRQDRDASVTVSGAAIAQRPQDFARLDHEQMVGPYDLISVMHYPWSMPPTPGNPTGTQQPITKISPLPPNPPLGWPNPNVPSMGDAQGVQFMYGIVPDHTPVAALRRTDWHMELWVVGADEVVRGAWFDGMWRTWYQLHERAFPQRGHLAVLSRNENHMELFGIGKDAQLHAIFFDGQWREWRTLGAPAIPGLVTGLTTPLAPGAPLAVRSRKENHVEVWVIGADGEVYHRWWEAGNDWVDWHKLPSPTAGPNGSPLVPGGHLAVHSRHENHVEIWSVDTEAMLCHTWWDGNQWQNWHRLPTPVAGPSGFRLQPGGHLAVLGRNENHMEVWSIGTDKRLHGIWWDGSNWRDWYTLAGQTFPAGAPLVALSRHDDHMEVYSVTEGDRLFGVFWDGNWQPWHMINPLPVARNTPLAGLSRNESHLEVWCVAPDGATADDVGVQGVWYNGSAWNGFYRVT